MSIARGGASALGSKAISAIAIIISLPLTLNYLGVEKYGLWITLYSIIAWLSLFDLGLSNGLMHVLTEAYGKGRSDIAKSYVSAAVQGLTLIGVIVAALCVLMALNLDWPAIFSIENPSVASEFSNAIIAAILLFAIGLPLTVTGKIYIAYQKGELANYWATGATIGGLLGLAVAVKCGGNMQALVFGFAGGQFLVNATSTIWLFSRAMPELRPSLSIGGHPYTRVFNASASIFVAQFATLLYFQSPNVIISSRIGPEHVAPFHATWNLFFYITLPQMLVGANIWAAIGEAYVKKDYTWISIIFRRYVKLSALIAPPVIILVVVNYEAIITSWAGPTALADADIVYLMAIWAFILVLTQPVVAFVLGTDKVKHYAGISLASSLSSVVGAYSFSSDFGVAAIISSIILGMTINLCAAYYLLVRQ